MGEIECLLCMELGELCDYHSAKSAEDLIRAFLENLKEHKALGLQGYFLAISSNILNQIPPRLRSLIGKLKTKELLMRWKEIHESDTFDVIDWLSLASIALACAVIQQYSPEDGTSPS